MTEHCIRTYETIDGKVFTNKDEAQYYENMYIYDNSGFRFYKKDELISDIDDCYDECDYFIVDHSKTEFNKLFLEMAYEYYGWMIPVDILNQTGTKYVDKDDTWVCE